MDLNFDNYIFDLYGTLIDIHTDWYCDETWEKFCFALGRLGLKTIAPDKMNKEFYRRENLKKEAAQTTWGFKYPEIDVTKVYKDMLIEFGNPKELFTKQFLDEIGYSFRVASREYIRLFPGVTEYLAKLREAGKHPFVLSNAQSSWTRPEIKLMGLDTMVEDILISSEERCRKPDVRFYNLMLDKHHMDKSKTVMTGDHYECDCQGAMDAGISAVWLNGENAADRYYLRQISE